MPLRISVRKHPLAQLVYAVCDISNYLCHPIQYFKRTIVMSKIQVSPKAITNLATFVLQNYGHIHDTIENGIALTGQTFGNVKMTAVAVQDLFVETAKHMQAVENEGVLKGIEKKKAVLLFIEKEFIATKDELKTIWNGWRTAVANFIDQLISMLNAGHNVLPAFME